MQESDGHNAIAQFPLVLDPMELFDKYGFGDGDMCDDVVDHWADTAWPERQYPGCGEDEEHPVHRYVRPRALLCVLAARHLEPHLKIPGGVRLAYGGGVHNPLLLRTPDGGYMHEDSVLGQAVARHLAGVPPITVPASVLPGLCELTFPQRPLGWLKLMDQLTWHYGFKRALPSPDPLMAYDTFTLGSFVDTYAAVLDDGVLGLAAELLRSGEPHGAYGATDSRHEVHAALLSAHTVASPDPARPIPDVDAVIAGLRPGLLAPPPPAVPRVVRVRTDGSRAPHVSR